MAYGRPELLVKFIGIGAVVALGGGVTLLVQVTRNLRQRGRPMH